MYRPTQLKKIWLRDLTRARVRKISRAKSAVIHFFEKLNLKKILKMLKSPNFTIDTTHQAIRVTHKISD